MVETPTMWALLARNWCAANKTEDCRREPHANSQTNHRRLMRPFFPKDSSSGSSIHSMEFIKYWCSSVTKIDWIPE